MKQNELTKTLVMISKIPFILYALYKNIYQRF